MDTALVTGMFEKSFLPTKQVEQDVNVDKGCFNKIFESSLKNKEIGKNDIKDDKINKEVDSEELINKELESENKSNDDNIIDKESNNIEEDKGKPKKKDKKNIEDISINDFDIQSNFTKLTKEELNIEDVKIQVDGIKEEVDLQNKDVINLIGSVNNQGIEELQLTPEEKLDSLLSKLDVEFNQNVKLEDVSENVIKVGPQSVETEKIELNVKDVDEKMDVENLEDVKSQDAEVSFDVQKNSEESLIDGDELEKKDFKNITYEKKDVENKENKKVDQNKTEQNIVKENPTNKEGLDQKDNRSPKQKEDKFKIKDFRNKKDIDTNQKFFEKSDVKLEDKFEIKDVNNIGKFENIDVDQIDILDQVTEKLEVSLFDNKSEMVIKLKPNDLGNVTVKISIENGVMNAKFLADSIKVKEALESNLNNLKESLKDQGLNVQDLNVSVDSGRSENHNFERNNLLYFNNKRDYQLNKSLSYEESYYQASNNERQVQNYWMDSTVSFLA